jgi:serine/threonine protein kinase
VSGYEITYLAECAIAPLKLSRLSYVIIYADILRVTNVAWVRGDRLQGGKYTIERELGRGRFGITYLVRNSKSDRLVVKTLNDDLLRSLTQQERERLEKMFWQEAVKLTRCKHKHIVIV